MMTNNLEWNKIEKILKFIKYNDKNDDFYAYIPDNHVIVHSKNQSHTINKLRLYQKSTQTVIKIGDIDFYCELLTRKSDNSVLLSIEYKDDKNNKKVKDIQEKRLIKYIESLLLGFDKYGKEYQDNPSEFYKDNNKIICEYDEEEW